MTNIINSISKEQNKHDVMSLLKLRTTVVDRMKKINPVPPVYNTQVEDVKYERPEHQNAKAKNVVNSFLGQIKIDQANGTVHINGQQMAAGIDQAALPCSPTIAQPQHNILNPHLLKTVWREGIVKSIFRSLASDSQGRVWGIYDPVSPIIEKVDKNGTTVEKVSCGKDISGIAILSGAKMVISCPSQKCLLTVDGLDTNNLKQSFMSHLSGTPASVYCYGGQVYVLMGGSGSAQGLYNPDTMCWISKTSLLNEPFDFAVTRVDGKLSAIITDPVGQQVVFLQEINGIFEVQCVYKGEGLENSRNFQPKGISLTNRGHVLVADEGNSFILQLDERRGILNGIIRMDAIGIKKPKVVCFTKNGTWVSSAAGGLYIINCGF